MAAATALDMYRKASRISFVFTVVAALLFAFGICVILIRYIGSNSNLEYTFELTKRGDYAASEAHARSKVVVLGPDSVQGQRAISGVATADFWSGDKEKRIEAVRLTKEQLLTIPGSNYNQALLINRLLGYITTAMEPEVIDEIFTGDPWSSMKVEGDDLASLKSLAEYSLAKKYTNFANFKVGIWRASKIFKHYDGYVPLSNGSLASEVAAIQNILAKTDENFALEEKEIAGRPYWEVQAPAFYYFQGFLYGALALVHPEELKKSEDAFLKVRDYYRYRRNADDSPNAMIEARVVYADFSLATYKYAIEGNKALREVRADLQEMIDLMDAHPDWHNGAFLAFMHQTVLDGPEKTKGRWYSYARFKQMADIYEPFKDFLNKHGWNL